MWHLLHKEDHIRYICGQVCTRLLHCLYIYPAHRSGSLHDALNHSSNDEAMHDTIFTNCEVKQRRGIDSTYRQTGRAFTVIEVP